MLPLCYGGEAEKKTSFNLMGPVENSIRLGRKKYHSRQFFSISFRFDQKEIKAIVRRGLELRGIIFLKEIMKKQEATERERERERQESVRV